MAKKARKRSSAGKSTHANALDKNRKALEHHTKELTRHAAAMAMHTATLLRINARQFVYSILQEPLTLPDSTPLIKLGLDPGALTGTAAEIRARGVNVDTG